MAGSTDSEGDQGRVCGQEYQAVRDITVPCYRPGHSAAVTMDSLQFTAPRVRVLATLGLCVIVGSCPGWRDSARLSSGVWSSHKQLKPSLIGPEGQAKCTVSRDSFNLTGYQGAKSHGASLPNKIISGP